MCSPRKARANGCILIRPYSEPDFWKFDFAFEWSDLIGSSLLRLCREPVGTIGVAVSFFDGKDGRPGANVVGCFRVCPGPVCGLPQHMTEDATTISEMRLMSDAVREQFERILADQDAAAAAAADNGRPEPAAEPVSDR